MDGTTLIQDLAIVLLAGGIAGMLCKRLGLSVIVGYLGAGIMIGPFTPPFSLIMDVARIQTLSQVGLVFLMFAIGLGLSLTKLGRMGAATLIATGLGAFFMLNFTQLLGQFMGWTSLQSLFIAALFMVSSSAVIAKIVQELGLGHEQYAQRALTITVLEDAVAVVMLTVLSTRANVGMANEDASVGGMLATMGAFVVVLVGAGLLLVPRLLRKLEARADPELQTITVAGVLFLLALCAAKAGYSLALGAFLLGAIVAEIPQKNGIEKSFAGMRDLFSSVFFVSIGMMIEVQLLADVWPLILLLWAFVMIFRPLACSIALILVGVAPREARRAGLLLTPLGEFSFIIAQLGVTAAVLPKSYYPLAVGTSILTVLATPLINRYANGIVAGLERLEPRLITRALDAYYGWMQQLQNRQSPAIAWKLIRYRLFQMALEMMFITGILIFAKPVYTALENSVVSNWLEAEMLTYVFWSAVGILVLIPLVSIWRNGGATAMIIAESLSAASRLPAPVITTTLRAAFAVGLGYWLYALLPFESLSTWGWIVIGIAALAVIGFFSSKLIYWHSTWQSSVNDVLAENPDSPEEARAKARAAMGHSLNEWQLRLTEYEVPDNAAYAGQTLAQLNIPTQFGCAVIEVERNGHVITSVGPGLRLYPGDKLLLLGQGDTTMKARRFLSDQIKSIDDDDEFEGSVLDTFTVPDGPHVGKTLAELPEVRTTGVRVAGIRRDGTQIINPTGADRLEAGDSLLVVGTLTELRRFRSWLRGSKSAKPA